MGGWSSLFDEAANSRPLMGKGLCVSTNRLLSLEGHPCTFLPTKVGIRTIRIQHY
jgi:hypothetical protein